MNFYTLSADANHATECNRLNRLIDGLGNERHLHAIADAMIMIAIDAYWDPIIWGRRQTG